VALMAITSSIFELFREKHFRIVEFWKQVTMMAVVVVATTLTILLLFWLVSLVIGFFRKSTYLELPQHLEIEGDKIRFYDERNTLYREFRLSQIKRIEEGTEQRAFESARIFVDESIGPFGKKDYFMVMPGLMGYSRLMRRLFSLPQMQHMTVEKTRWTSSIQGSESLCWATLALAAGIILAGLTVISIVNPRFLWGVGAPDWIKWATLAVSLLFAGISANKFRTTLTSIEVMPWGFDVTIGWLIHRKIRSEDIVSVESIPAYWSSPERRRIRLRNGYYDVSPASISDYIDLVEYLEGCIER
jgi:hypothetical protein